MRKYFCQKWSSSLAPTLQPYFVISCILKSIFSGLKYVLLPQFLMDFHDFRGILLKILVSIFWVTYYFVELPTWKKYLSWAWFMVTPRNVLKTKNTLDDRFSRYKKLKLHWIRTFEWNLIVKNDIQPNSTKKC